MQYDSYSYGSFYCTMQLKVFVYITCKKSVFFVHLLLPLSRVERQTDRERENFRVWFWLSGFVYVFVFNCS